MTENIRFFFWKLLPVVFAAIVFLIVISAKPRMGWAEPADEEIDFTSLSFEELKNIIIVTASRKPEKLTESAAAVFVITSE